MTVYNRPLDEEIEEMQQKSRQILGKYADNDEYTAILEKLNEESEEEAI